MEANLIDRLRCSPILRRPSSPELATWFGEAEGDSTEHPVQVRPRRASLSLVLRQVEGEVEMLVIKRAVSLRCDILTEHTSLD